MLLKTLKKFLNYKNMNCKLLLPTEKILLENGSQTFNKELRNKLKMKDRNCYLKEYQTKMKNILNKQYLIEENTKVNPILISNYFSKIINNTPYIIKTYLSNYIYLKVSSKNKTNIYNIDFMKKNITNVEHVSSCNKNVIINVSPFVINDVCKKSHWNSLGVSKRFEIWISPDNKRYLVFNFCAI